MAQFNVHSLPSISKLYDWRDEKKAEQLQWYDAIQAIKSTRDSAAIQAGFDAGFRAALTLLEIHAGLKFPD